MSRVRSIEDFIKTDFLTTRELGYIKRTLSIKFKRLYNVLEIFNIDRSLHPKYVASSRDLIKAFKYFCTYPYKHKDHNILKNYDKLEILDFENIKKIASVGNFFQLLATSQYLLLKKLDNFTKDNKEFMEYITNYKGEDLKKYIELVEDLDEDGQKSIL